MLGSAAKYILCLLYARTVGSLPKQHQGCSDFFQQSITLGLSHFYPDTNGKYFPGLISTDQRHFLNREEPHGPGRRGERCPQGNYFTEETRGAARSQWDAPRADGVSQDTIPARPGAVSKAIHPFSSQLIWEKKKKLGVYSHAGQTQHLRVSRAGGGDAGAGCI